MDKQKQADERNAQNENLFEELRVNRAAQGHDPLQREEETVHRQRHANQDNEDKTSTTVRFI